MSRAVGGIILAPKRKPTPARIEVLKDQIAHLKVLLNVAEQELPVRQRDMVTATQNLMVAEAQIATFRFRITELQDEITSGKAR